LEASEVVEETSTQVIVREHPQTGKPYVTIISADTAESKGPFETQGKKYARPDYRMLDPKVKAGDIPYDGPWSDRKKVYIFAASLMTVGVVGGGIGMAVAPAASTGAAAGGGGAYLAAGTAVTAGSAATAAVATQPDPKRDDYDHKSESKLLEQETKQ
jgi:hypothetical protein